MVLLTSQPPGEPPEGWTECMLSAQAKHILISTPGYPKPLLQPSARNHRIDDTPDMGKAMFATRNLNTGQFILCERPMTMTPLEMSAAIEFGPEFTKEQHMQATLFEWEKKMKLVFNRMPPAHQTAYMALANSHKQDGSGPLTGIIRTNGFGIYDIQQATSTGTETPGRKREAYSVICNDISRMNHSCSPNTFKVFELASLSFQVYAIRDIKKGEQLTVQYTDIMQPFADRKEALAPYGFECTCASCQNPTVSDALRREIATLPPLQQLIMSAPRSLYMRFEHNLKQIAIMEKEGLQCSGWYLTYLRVVRQTYIYMGDQAKVSEYDRKLEKLRLLEELVCPGLSELCP